MNKDFLELCYLLLSYYEHVPEVADTIKSVLKGKEILDNYPKNGLDFQQRKSKIIDYIIESRTNNIIYTYRSSKRIFLPFGAGKTIYEDDIEELRVQLEGELAMLILKGIHQTIKHLYPTLNDDSLSEELLRQDVCTLQKYSIYHNGNNA